MTTEEHEKQPQLSVILPVYNVQNYLKRSLESILNQNYSDFELICIDDGSTDNSLSILKEYAQKDKRIIIKTKKNGGLSSARNAGLEIASGKYIGFIDSDDYISPEMYDELIRLIEEDQCDLAGCGIKVIYEAWDKHKNADMEYFKIRFGRNVIVDNYLFDKMNVSSVNKIFRRDLIEKYKLRFPEGLWYEDGPFYWCYLSISNKVSFTPIQYYMYIRHPASIMGQTYSQKTEKSLDNLRTVFVVLNFLKLNDRFQKYLKAFRIFFVDNFWFSFKYLPIKKKYLSLLTAFQILKAEPDIGKIHILIVFCQRILQKIFKKLKIKFQRSNIFFIL